METEENTCHVSTCPGCGTEFADSELVAANKRIKQLEDVVRTTFGMGFYLVTPDSGITHRDTVNKVLELFPDFRDC